MSLVMSRRLLPLLVTQTLAAVNDNLFKQALVVLILARLGERGPALVAISGAVFIVPAVLLSVTAGQIADRFEKSRSIVVLKLIEAGLMGLAGAGFLLGSLPMLFVVLLGLGLQSTFFGPLKYAILPDHLPERELVSGNGLIEAGTFLGIIVGAMAGTALFGLAHGPAIISGLGLVVGAAGVGAAMMIPRAAPTSRVAIERDVVGATWRLLLAAQRNRVVWLSILGLGWFWVVASTIMSELPALIWNDLHADAQVLTLILVVFAVGTGAGSLLCAKLQRGEVTARLVPWASLGCSVFLWDFARAATHGQGLVTVGAMVSQPAGWRMLADLVLLAVCGGLFSVPLYTLIQDRSAPGEQGRMVAAGGVVSALAMAVGSFATAGMAGAGVKAVAVLMGAAVLNLGVAGWIGRTVWRGMDWRQAVRGVAQWCFRAFHGARVSGLENVPAEGRVVFVCNHTSLLDGLFVAAFLPGEVGFAVNRRMAATWWVKPFLRPVRIVEIDPLSPFSTRTMVRAVQDGARLVVFPEGRLTTTGTLMKVYDGAGMIADAAGAVLVPVRIDGLQHSRLSQVPGRRRWFPRVSLTVLPAVSVNVDAAQGHARRAAVGALLQRVMEGARMATAGIDRSLFRALVDAVRLHGAGTPIVEDTERRLTSYRRVLTAAAVLGRRLAREARPGEAVGMMVPNSTAAVVAFMGLQAFGRVPAMLNHTAGVEGMLSACAAAEVRVVVSSRRFVAQAKLEEVVARMGGTVRFVWLEDVRATLGWGAKLRGWWDGRRAGGLPGALVDAVSPAVVLFTSGSEGAPKGVVLSHRNILANIAQAGTVVDFNVTDKLFNAMPMFHSFGLTAGTLLPLLSGVQAVQWPSPLQYRAVPEVIYDANCTMAFGTDTFLAGWARFAHPYDFYRMRLVFAGAERLREETRALYAERFGVRVLEGYGTTETSPVLALNTPMHARVGSAGRLLPGIQHRLEPVEGIAAGGRLWVRGPNVMLGYVRASAPGVLEAPEGGWYDTGDVCTVEDGYVTIVARAKRFAKVAGEMVSMPAAEGLAAEVWPGAAHAVVAVPDGRKGEALVLLTTQAGATAGALLAAARGRGVAEIMVPRVVRVVDALPLLGSGKVDYAAAGRLAEGERAAA